MKRIVLNLLLMVLSIVGLSYAGDAPKAVIVFDASGSMWGQIKGVTKIEIARDALKNVVEKWNPNVELGVTAYGHRKKGDCNDIENIIPVGKVDKNRVIQTVMAIQPKGKTPISRSLRKAAEALKYTEEKATIILISDGKETCDTDPCAAAKELEKKGIDFVTHVIGFNVDKKTDKQLECIANVTGGEYFSAKDAKALNKAMKNIVKKVEVVKPKPKPVVKKLKNNLEITASETEGGKWVSAIHYIHYIVDGEKEEQVTNCWSEKKKSCLEQIPVGKYIMVSEYNEFKRETAIEIKAGERLKVNVVMGQTGKIEITASETEGGKWVSAIHYIHYIVDGEKEEQVINCWSEKKKSCVEQIPVGKYIMVSEYNKFKRETDIEIKAGETNKLNVVFAQTNKVIISASERESGKWVEAFHDIYSVEDKDSSITNCWSEKKKECLRQIPVGKYVLKSTYNEFKKETNFEIKAIEATKLHIVFEQFRIEAKCIDMNSKISYEVYARSGRMVYDTQKSCSEVVQLTLGAGDYSVEAKIGNDVKEERFTIGGDSSTLIIDMTTIKKELTHEALIKADTETKAEPVVEKKINTNAKKDKHSNQANMKEAAQGLGQLGALLGQMSKAVGEENSKDMQGAGAFLKALGGLVDPKKTEAIKKEIAQEKQIQQEENKKADKAFDEMSQELEMFTN